jgi:hypothetical protein
VAVVLPDYNEIALEKNLLYFQRTLKKLGYEPSQAAMFFANGNDGQATVRYIDQVDELEKFKVPQIPSPQGRGHPGEFRNLAGWRSPGKFCHADLFVYFHWAWGFESTEC